MKEKWSNFLVNDFEDLLNYIDEYAFLIEGAKARDYEMWNKAGSDVSELKQWLENRFTFMTGYINNL